MKYYSGVLYLATLLLISGCAQKEVPQEVINAVGSISEKWVPIHSETLCNVSVERGAEKALVVRGETSIPEAKTEIIDYLASEGYSIIDSMRVLPDTSVVKKPWGVVRLSVSTMRSEPSDKTEIVTQAIMGTPVKILDKESGWILIQTPDSYIGWADDGDVTEYSAEQFEVWKSADRLFFKENLGLIKDTKGNVVSDLVFGSVIEKKGERGGEYIVELPDGRSGMVGKSSVAGFREWAETNNATIDEMISFGRSMLGLPYLWGGTSTKTIDCSGFVKTVYLYGGLILARDASSQYLHGAEVSIENPSETLEPGDLLFFGRMKDGEKRITHVGLYMGDTEVIHSSGMVKINSIDSTRSDFSPRLRKMLMGAKRIYGLPSEAGLEHISQNNWYF